MNDLFFKNIDKELEKTINSCLEGKEQVVTKFGNAKIDKNGYYRITSGKEGNNGKFLHRLIWEDYYGKPFPDGYDIHHINMVKTDNRIQNLQCVEHSLHVRFHKQNTTGYYRVIKKERKNTKQGFTWVYRYYKNGKRKYISSVDLDKLEEKVKAKGLPWYKLENINTSTL